jgi:hypothetical protein
MHCTSWLITTNSVANKPEELIILEVIRRVLQVYKYSKVVEPGAFGSFIGKLDLTIQNGSKRFLRIKVDSPNKTGC